MLKLGSHLSCERGYMKMAENAKSIGANAVQFFTRNPRGGRAASEDAEEMSEFREYCKDQGIVSLIGYAPYTINPASDDMSKRDFAESVLAEDIARMENLPNQLYALHAGHAMGLTPEQATDNAARALNAVISPTQTTTVLVVQNAGEGTAICSTFEEIADLIGKIDLKDHIGVCFDTSAAWAAGYDIVNSLDGVLDDFDRIIGLDKIKEVHLTDTLEEKGSKVDRHAVLGDGKIGIEALVRVMKNPRLSGRPFILEEKSPTLEEYRTQIARLKSLYGEGA